ncbi:MAG: multiheme c-type cytochrome [Planctomycetota bacterium]
MARPRYVPAIGPRLRMLLWVVLGLFAVLGLNAVYLSAITVLEWSTGRTYQNYFYQLMFLAHLALGLLLIAPVVVFGVIHIRNAHDRPNRRAVRAGYALFASALALLGSGLALTRFEGFAIVDPGARSIIYWTHALAPIVAIWLYVLHRLAGPPIRWRIGATWGAVATAVALVMVAFHAQDPRAWNVAGPASGERYFFPSLARTATGNFIPADALMMDRYCAECHADAHAQWSVGAHRFSSFNNPAYLFSVRETRRVAMERDGDVQASRFCAGCHDPVPFFSGAFDDPDFDDVAHPTANAGITCTACHAITHLNSRRGNADFTIEEPVHYPFARSENGFLRWINRQLVKAKPALHKKTFLKPLHRTAEFCGACHKVHLPPELNHYKWLRGQNHQDTYHLSGVSGHGVSSFYYPEKATHDCATCHMPLTPSGDFGAADRDGSGDLKIHDHLFPSANTALPHLLGMPEHVIEAHRRFNDGVMRVDLFGVKDGGTIEGTLHGPLRPALPALRPGRRYLLESVIRTLKMGHAFTQGTADSNEIWLEVTVTSGGRVIGKSGGRNADGAVDPWSHFVNVYMLDREGQRIDRRNAEDIFVPLYNHQIPPGAAQVVHYALQVPADATDPITVALALRYRKFDTTYLRYFQGEAFDGNDLPVMTLAEDTVTFPVADVGSPTAPTNAPAWQRWNDYGIGLLLKSEGASGELRQAEAAFTQVEALGRADGPLNLARVYLREGRLDDARDALQRAAQAQPPAPAWSLLWFGGVVNKQNGFLDEAIADFEQLVHLDTAETRRREFDFSQDWRLLNELGQTLVERARAERGPARRADREALLRRARERFDQALALDPENVTAHYNLALIGDELGDTEAAAQHRDAHARYKPDDNARDRAVGRARRADPAADHAAEAVVLYDLHRADAFGRDG